MKLLGAIVAAFVLTLCTQAQPAAKSVTVPITLDHNRTIIDVYLPLPDGTSKRIRAWVDNGNAELWITQALATKLGLSFSGDAKPALDGRQRAVQAPNSLQVGGMDISLAGIPKAQALLDRDSVAPGCSAEITIPSSVLRNYDVLFDYPNRQFTIGPPDSIQFKGVSSKGLLNSQNGLIQLPSKINGEEFNLALDVGASITLLSRERIAQWHKAEPSWPSMVGGVASANMWGSEEETRWQLLRIPRIQFGAAPLKNVAAASFPDEELKWFQNRAGVPTIGLIGANALLDDRVGIDYAHSTVYLERTSPTSAPDMDVVGLMLRPEPDGRYTVLGVADYDGKPSVPDLKAGDVLVGVDGAPATGATMGQVWSLLGGAPGQIRTLTLEREGKRVTVDAPVRRFLAPESKPAVKSPRRTPHRGN
jgi:predicted aspartyl protease